MTQFIVIETDRPDRVAIVPLDEPDRVVVRELARASTLAELMNRIEDEELRRCRAKHATAAANPPVPAAEVYDLDDRIELLDPVLPPGAATVADDDEPDDEDATALEVVNPRGG